MTENLDPLSAAVCAVLGANTILEARRAADGYLLLFTDSEMREEAFALLVTASDNSLFATARDQWRAMCDALDIDPSVFPAEATEQSTRIEKAARAAAYMATDNVISLLSTLVYGKADFMFDKLLMRAEVELEEVMYDESRHQTWAIVERLVTCKALLHNAATSPPVENMLDMRRQIIQAAATADIPFESLSTIVAMLHELCTAAMLFRFQCELADTATADTRALMSHFGTDSDQFDDLVERMHVVNVLREHAGLLPSCEFDVQKSDFVKVDELP